MKIREFTNPVIITILFQFLSLYVVGQNNIVIKGKVVDAQTLEPVAYSSVAVLGKRTGTTTDINGLFCLTVVDSVNLKLVVSHINYFKQQTNITNGFANILLEPKNRQFDQIIVSATLSNQLVHKTPKPVNIITNRQVSDNINSNLADMLSRTPGFTQVWEYHSPLLLRGMNSNRLLVLKNGSRRIGTFPGGYFGQDLNIYEAKKIEVIKGPGSVIYGSGAISGIINIIGAEPFGKKHTAVRVLSAYGAVNNEILGLVSVCNKTEKAGINVQAKWRKTGNYKYADGKIAENSNVEDRDLSINTGFKISNKQTVTINADYHYGDWGKPRGFNGPAKYFTLIRNVEHGLHSAVKYVIEPGNIIKKVVANFYYDNGSRNYYQYKHSEITGKKTSLDLVKYTDNYGGLQLFTVINPTRNLNVTMGSDSYIFRINSPVYYYDYYNNTQGYDPGYKNAGQQCIGLFVNNDWQINSKLNIIAGARYDWATVVEGFFKDTLRGDVACNAVSGNVGLVFMPVKNKYLSFNVGRAFRMPITEELFTETVSCKGIKKGNPNLKPEQSWNFDAGFRGSSFDNAMNFDFALFYNFIDSYINETADTINDNVDFTYKNTDALLLGGEFALSYMFSNVLYFGNNLLTGLSGSYVYGIDKSINVKNAPLFGVPPFKLLADVRYQGLMQKFWLSGYYFLIEGEYAAGQNRVAGIPAGSDGGPWGYEVSDPHFVFNVAVGVNSNLIVGLPKLRFVVNNVFNNNYRTFGSYLPVMGRNFKLLLAFNF